MSMYLKHFTVVGDDPTQWNNDYKKWEEEEMEEEGEGKTPDTAIKVDSAPRPPSFREILIVCLVILDAVLVLGELLLDLKIIHPDKDEIAPKVFHYLSLSILTLFLVEVSFKLFAYRLEFFKHKFEVLDAIVVIVSFVLDIVLLFREHEFEALGLLILLRLWRVARIINGIILSVKTRSEQQVSKLKQANMQLTVKVQQLESSCAEKVKAVSSATLSLIQLKLDGYKWHKQDINLSFGFGRI
ncbi:hypothetical protein JD844_015206 [Phrynosoma platyrhinos]|uniref:Voltage-gated hydrogen channel 1 n=1 Tax=Phrynosoma platyrhinos TaxID=52577 RepID=A0ABQ7T7B6_PHRPL|nr:hypothetical protein JD844_015206 [Phrynosoma platyrhinos]